MTRTTVGTLLAVLMCWGTLHGQNAGTRLEFEVASVKPAPTLVDGVDYSTRGGPGTNDPGLFTCPRDSLFGLLMKAYGVGMDQILGPDWIQAERYSNMYSVVAKIPPGATENQFRLMLQNLLAERFHLTLHHETREFQVYSLLVAEGGQKMKPSSPDANAKAGPDQFRLDSKGFPLLRSGERV